MLEGLVSTRHEDSVVAFEMLIRMVGVLDCYVGAPVSEDVHQEFRQQAIECRNMEVW